MDEAALINDCIEIAKLSDEIEKRKLFATVIENAKILASKDIFGI